MQIAYVAIHHFRGINEAKVYFNGHSVIIGDNNAGKSTIFEAIDLVLGPDRLNRTPVVDEHDFYNGEYFYNGDEQDEIPKIEIEILVIDLEDSQISRFKNNLEFWNEKENSLLKEGEIGIIDKPNISPALRVKFIGSYNPDDDDFEGETFFCSPANEDVRLSKFSKRDKRECGFLYLRALRTGARALSMERGSLLDIILRIREIRPKMWEDILVQLRKTDVATDPSLGIKNILGNVQEALKEFVPSDWGAEPLLRVSDLTREHLRKTLTVFMSTGGNTYHAPFQHQGTGTINTMVLALLSMIAEAKKNVIFAMEEPEVAIPPYTQKRIIDSIRKKSTQAIFTSHSPFVLEEFRPEQIVLIERNEKGKVTSQAVYFPTTIKPKAYNVAFRLRFAEALLAKRVLLTEGATEATAYPAAGRRLNELAPSKFNSLEAMGVAVFDVMSESAIALYAEYFRKLGKMVFAVFDKQTDEAKDKIERWVNHPFESPYKGFETLMAEETSESIIRKFYEELINDGQWPTHLDKYKPEDNSSFDKYKEAIKKYLSYTKGARGAADLIGICEEIDDVPKTVRSVLKELWTILNPNVKDQKLNDF